MLLSFLATILDFVVVHWLFDVPTTCFIWLTAISPVVWQAACWTLPELYGKSHRHRKSKSASDSAKTGSSAKKKDRKPHISRRRNIRNALSIVAYFPTINSVIVAIVFDYPILDSLFRAFIPPARLTVLVILLLILSVVLIVDSVLIAMTIGWIDDSNREKVSNFLEPFSDHVFQILQCAIFQCAWRCFLFPKLLETLPKLTACLVHNVFWSCFNLICISIIHLPTRRRYSSSESKRKKSCRKRSRNRRKDTSTTSIFSSSRRKKTRKFRRQEEETPRTPQLCSTKIVSRNIQFEIVFDMSEYLHHKAQEKKSCGRTAVSSYDENLSHRFLCSKCRNAFEQEKLTMNSETEEDEDDSCNTIARMAMKAIADGSKDDSMYCGDCRACRIARHKSHCRKCAKKESVGEIVVLQERYDVELKSLVDIVYYFVCSTGFGLILDAITLNAEFSIWPAAVLRHVVNIIAPGYFGPFLCSGSEETDGMRSQLQQTIFAGFASVATTTFAFAEYT